MHGNAVAVISRFPGLFIIFHGRLRRHFDISVLLRVAQLLLDGIRMPLDDKNAFFHHLFPN